VHTAFLAGSSRLVEKLSLPDSLPDITPQTRWVKDTVQCCSCCRLALWTGKGGGRRGVKEQEREISFSEWPRAPKSAPALTCPG